MDKSKRKVLEGVAVGQGRVKGKVKVITKPENTGKVKEGNILVAEFTNPLFTPAILKASAIITDKGGKTCHAALVAREFGIPCVVGTEKATKELENDMEVIVDGSEGIIYR